MPTSRSVTLQENALPVQVTFEIPTRDLTSSIATFFNTHPYRTVLLPGELVGIRKYRFDSNFEEVSPGGDIVYTDTDTERAWTVELVSSSDTHFTLEFFHPGDLVQHGNEIVSFEFVYLAPYRVDWWIYWRSEWAIGELKENLSFSQIEVTVLDDDLPGEAGWEEYIEANLAELREFQKELDRFEALNELLKTVLNDLRDAQANFDQSQTDLGNNLGMFFLGQAIGNLDPSLKQAFNMSGIVQGHQQYLDTGDTTAVAAAFANWSQDLGNAIDDLPVEGRLALKKVGMAGNFLEAWQLAAGTGSVWGSLARLNAAEDAAEDALAAVRAYQNDPDFREQATRMSEFAQQYNEWKQIELDETGISVDPESSTSIFSLETRTSTSLSNFTLDDTFTAPFLVLTNRDAPINADLSSRSERVVAELSDYENVITTGEGSDRIIMGSETNSVSTMGGNDRIEGGSGVHFVATGEGSDVIALQATSMFDNTLVAWNVSAAWQAGTNVRLSLEGKLRYEAVVNGGAGLDALELGDGNDAFFLHDAYSGFHSSIALTGDNFGQMSAARLEDLERIYARGGDDIIDLTSSDYSLAGQSLFVFAGSGDDTIWGSDADEMLAGQAGNDVLFGGAGSDTLLGGEGADVFEFTHTSTDVFLPDFSLEDGDKLRFYNADGINFDPSTVEIFETTLSIAFQRADGYTSFLEIGTTEAALAEVNTVGYLISAIEII